MRRSFPLLFQNTPPLRENLVQIRNGTFYRQHPTVGEEDSSASNPPLFSNLTFKLPAGDDQHPGQHWAVVGTAGVTTLLEILRGVHICLPTNARSFPYLSSDAIAQKDPRLRIPSRAIQYVGFNGGKGSSSEVRGAYLSARYESRREETDWSVLQYLKGETDLNPSEEPEGKDSEDEALLSQVIRNLRLEKLVTMPVSNLSNGQTRRARIARALLGRPELLLLDEPFMGLDPPTLVTLSPILRDLAYNASPRLLLALRPQDPIPDWITHLMILGTNHTISLMGPKDEVLFRAHRWADMHRPHRSKAYNMAIRMAVEMSKTYGPPLQELGHSLTSKGILSYGAYEAAKNYTRQATKSKTYQPVEDPYSWRPFQLHGKMNPWFLDPSSQAKYKRALSVPESRLTIPDLLDLTALVPTAPPEKLGGERTSLDAGIASCTAIEQQEGVSHKLGEDLKSPGSLKDWEPLIGLSDQPAGGSKGLLGDPKSPKSDKLGEPLIELSSVVVKYGDKIVLGHSPPQPGFSQPGLNLDIRQGTRLALLGPNGSGKTTLLSLLTSDHPHSYSLPIKFFGRSRLPSPGKSGLSLFEIQSRIGHSSPEIHAFFPKHLTIRQTLESAWAETFGARPKLTYAADQTVDVFLNWWQHELNQESPHQPKHHAGHKIKPHIRNYMPQNQVPQNRALYRAMWRAMLQSIPCPIWPDIPWFPFLSDPESEPLPTETNSIDWAELATFGDLAFSTQRLLLLLRAMIKKPDILVLDEAFSGLSPQARDKAMQWLRYGQTKYLKRSAKPVFKTGPTQYLQPRAPSLVENKRHVVDAALRRLGMAEEEVITRWSNSVATKAIRELRFIEDDEELRRYVEGYVEDTYWFKGLEDRQALVVVSHVKEEVPGVVDQWVRLPGEEEVSEYGKGVEMGICPDGEINTAEGWNRVWGFQ